MLVRPFSRCPVKRWDQDASALTVIAKSYQPLAANAAVMSLDQLPPAATLSVSV